MCRHNQLWGCMLLAFGLGLIVGKILQGSFLCSCLGVGMLILGFCVVYRK